MKLVEWGSGNGQVAVNGQLARNPTLLAGPIIEKHLNKNHLVITTDWDRHMPRRAEIPDYIWSDICSEIRAAILESDESHNRLQNEDVICIRCGARKSGGAMFTTLPRYRKICDDCA